MKREWRDGDYVEVKPKTSKVKDVLWYIWNMRLVILIMSFMLFILIIIPNIWHDEITAIREENKIIQEKQSDRNKLIKMTKDCSILQDEILYLISNGANADSWTPSLNDKSLKIGQERYQILC